MLMRQKAGGQILTTLTTPGISSCGRTKLWRDFRHYLIHFPLDIEHDESRENSTKNWGKITTGCQPTNVAPDSRTKQQQMRVLPQNLHSNWQKNRSIHFGYAV